MNSFLFYGLAEYLTKFLRILNEKSLISIKYFAWGQGFCWNLVPRFPGNIPPCCVHNCTAQLYKLPCESLAYVLSTNYRTSLIYLLRSDWSIRRPSPLLLPLFFSMLTTAILPRKSGCGKDLAKVKHFRVFPQWCSTALSLYNWTNRPPLWPIK